MTLVLIEELLKPVIESMGLILWGCEYSAGKQTARLRVYIDKADGSIDLDDCVRVSHEISPLLDVEAGLNSAYHLEVSSPGLNRPLFKEAHYSMSIGADIKLTLYDPVDGRRNFSGRLVAAEADQIQLCVPKVKREIKKGMEVSPDAGQAQTLVFALRDIKKARLVYDFSDPTGKKDRKKPAKKPGKKSN